MARFIKQFYVIFISTLFVFYISGSRKNCRSKECKRAEGFKGGRHRQLLNQALQSITDIEKRTITKDYSTAVAKATRLAGVHIFFETAVLPNPKDKTKNIIWILKPLRNQLLQETKEVAENNDSLGKAYKNYLKIIEGPRQQTVPTIMTLQDLDHVSEIILKQAKSLVPKFNWTKYIEEMFTDTDVSLDLSNANKFWIAVDNLDFVKEMLTFIYQQNTEKIEYIIRQEVTKILKIFTGNTEFE